MGPKSLTEQTYRCLCSTLVAEIDIAEDNGNYDVVEEYMTALNEIAGTEGESAQDTYDRIRPLVLGCKM